MSLLSTAVAAELSAGVVTIDAEYNIVDINQQLLAMSFFNRAELLNENITFLDENFLTTLKSQSKGFAFGHYFSNLTRKDADKLPVEVCFFTQQIAQKAYILLVFKVSNLPEQAKFSFSISEQIFNQSNEAIVITNADGIIQTVNHSFYKITGYTELEVIGKTPAILNSGKQDKYFYQSFWRKLKTKGYWQGEIWNKRKNGDIYPEWLNISSIRDKHQHITHYIAQFTDISARKKTEEERHFQAYHDSLTSLPNRYLLFERLKHLCSLHHSSPVHFAVLFCDLDRFKVINDTLGHDVGDALLQSVAKRFEAKLRNNDLIARSGGDEFIVVIEGEKALTNIDKICQQILLLFEAPFQTEFGEFKISISIGASQFAKDSYDIRELISFADVAMSKVKNSGGNHYGLFDAREKAKITQRLELEAEISTAIANKNFEVWYQPQVNTLTHEVYGIECLLRWNHPTQGMIGPDLFIPIAEASGAIKELGNFVLETACKQLRQWRINNIFTGIMAINVSLRQFERNDLLAQVRETLIKEMIPGDAIELEVTESVFSEGNCHHSPILSAIRGLGVKVAIDDFGTGYSSLQRLKNMPIDNVKIDKCFVNRIVYSRKDEAIIQALILLSKTFNVSLIAEGVETKQQAKKLTKLGCFNQQGYFYSKPLPAEQFELWLTNYHKECQLSKFGEKNEAYD